MPKTDMLFNVEQKLSVGSLREGFVRADLRHYKALDMDGDEGQPRHGDIEDTCIPVDSTSDSHLDLSLHIRAAPLVRANVKFTVKHTVCMSLRLAAYGEFDREFGFDSHEWSCS